MCIDAQIQATGKAIRALALRRQDAAERGDAEAFAALDAAYKAALDELAALGEAQFQSKRALRRGR